MTVASRLEQPQGARQLAVAVLDAVVRRGAFAAPTLDHYLKQHRVDSVAERALTTELVYGVLRTRGALIEALSRHASRGFSGTDPWVLQHLVVAAYQICFLERVPAFAAVDEAVGAVSKVRGKKVGGFCNAVLRRLSEQQALNLGTAIEASAPGWLKEQLERSVGREDALHLLGIAEPDASRAQLAIPALRLRVGCLAPPWLSGAERGQLYADAYKPKGGGDLRAHPEHEAGQYVIQDEGSMFAAHALGARPGEKVLDACAGRGHKSSLLAERVGPEGELWATDKTARKLVDLRRELERLRLKVPHTAVVDWTKECEDVPRDFDRVLVDAPCSGSGTLRRRPEIALRLLPSDVERLAAMAEQILRGAARHAKPGGRVQFVVCSVLSDECESLAQRVSDVLVPESFDVDHPELTGRTQLRLLPRSHGTDGFFIASFRSVSSG